MDKNSVLADLARVQYAINTEMCFFTIELAKVPMLNLYWPPSLRKAWEETIERFYSWGLEIEALKRQRLELSILRACLEREEETHRTGNDNLRDCNPI